MNNPWIAGLGILAFFAVGVLISPLWSLLENEKPKNDKIIYKTDSENVIAGDSKDGSRVRMTIKPKKE